MTVSAATDFLPFTRPAIDEATIASVAEVLRSGWISSGPKAAEFEARLSALFGGRAVRCFANGTATLEAALRVADIGPGDEVITTPITWVATANVIVAVGARPVFVDIDPLTRNLDLDAVEAAIGPATRAILPVYLAGLPVDMDRLYAIAQRRGLRVIEDAAQAIDSRWRGARIGSFGDLASFSFQANKNITSGEGGCLVLNDDGEARRAERWRLQGVIRSGEDGMDVETPGSKANLSDVHAAIGLGQLARLETVTARRTELAQRYFDCAGSLGFEELGIVMPPRDGIEGATPNWHMMQVELPVDAIVGGRAGVMRALREAGIGTGVHYPAVHRFSYYRAAGWRDGQLPQAERIGRAILTLPLFASMRDDDVERACEALATACRTLAS